MVKISKYKNCVEKFLHGPNGQRFFNVAFSIGAAVVILGAMFKILHLPYGSLILGIGMSTEVLMFILMAFDTPPREYAWEDVFPELDNSIETAPEKEPAGKEKAKAKAAATAPASSGTTASGGTVIIGAGNAGGIASGAPVSGDVISGDVISGGVISGNVEVPDSLQENLTRFEETTKKLNEVAEKLLRSYTTLSGDSGEIEQSSVGYAERMADLNRNIAGLNTIYEIQLKSVSSQLETIDRVNRSMKDIRDMYEKSANESVRYCEETEKMARYMRQLNAVYEKMITAMTVNMTNPVMGAASRENPFAENKD